MSEEQEDLKELCLGVKSKLEAQGRPFVFAVGGIPGSIESTQGIIISGDTHRIEFLLIEILRTLAQNEEEKEND